MLIQDICTVAAEGRRSPGEQRKLRALRHVLQLLDKGEAEYNWMSIGGGRHTSKQGAVRQFFQRADSAGQAWYLGTLPGGEAALHP